MRVVKGVFENIEVLLMLSFGLVWAAALFYQAPTVAIAVNPGASAATTAPMPVVVVSAKRMTAAQKRGVANTAPEDRGS